MDKYNLDQFLRPINSIINRIYTNAYNFDTQTERASVTNSTLQDQSVTNAKIVNLTADKITAGTISSGIVYAGTISGSQVTAGTISSGVVYSGTISGSQVTAGTIQANVGYLGTISANQLNAGSINAANIIVYNIDADRINSGEINANLVKIENLNGVTDSAGSTVINGGFITTGTINANLIQAGTLTGRTVNSSSGSSRIVLNSGDSLDFYNANTLKGRIRPATAGLGMVADTGSFVTENDEGFFASVNQDFDDFFKFFAGTVSGQGEAGVIELPTNNKMFITDASGNTLVSFSTTQMFSDKKIVADAGIEMNDNTIYEISMANFSENTSAPNNDDGIWYYKSGGNYSFRSKMEGTNWQFDQTSV